LLVHLSPGDPAAILAGDNATVEDVQRIRDSLGLDKPLVEQFFSWGWGVLQGDLGISTSTKVPVLSLIYQRMGPTVSIAFFTIVLAVLLAIPLGVTAAWWAGSVADRLIMLMSVLGFSIPVFLIGYGLV